MLQNAVSSCGSTQPLTATTPLSKVRRLWPIFMLAATLALTLWLALANISPAYATITPPYTADFTITGEVPFQDFGFSVASAGDINHDGFGDVVVGDDLGNKVFIYNGSNSGLTTTAFYSDTGLSGEDLGWSVGGGGDVNHDGIDDFIAGAPISGTGSAYVYHGSSSTLPARGATLTGEQSGDQFGWSVAIIGDVNGDGIADVAVGAPYYDTSRGRVYIYYGPVVGTVSPSKVLSGEHTLDFFGVSVARAGDVNGDGFDDLAVGAWQNDDGGLDAGKAYIYYGSLGGISPENNSFVIGNTGDQLGTSVHAAGDVNGDGYADVIVGSDVINTAGTNLGIASVYPGGPAGLISTPLYTTHGEIDEDHYGFVVTGNGDLDGDGFSDFGVGAYKFDTTLPVTTTDEGKAYGYVACTNGAIRPSQIFSDTGEAAGDNYGRSLTIAKDVNGDGIDDLVVGAYAVKNGPQVGKIYAYYGVKGGCRPQLQLNQLVSLADYPDIYTNTTAITVPIDAAIHYNYIIHNSGNVTLTRQTVVDDKWGLVTSAAYTLTPGASAALNISRTPGLLAAPGVSVTNVTTWTGAISISSPSGVTLPANRALSTFAVSSAQVNISGPTTDQDHDGVPDNQEGNGDSNHNLIPAYLDGTETVTNTNPGGTPPDTAIAGLSIAAPAGGYVNSPVIFAANITAGTNVTYTWDFGDGQSSTVNTATIQGGGNQAVSHTFTRPGAFVVHVTATNSVGQQTAQSSITIRFQLRLPAVVTFGFAGAP